MSYTRIKWMIVYIPPIMIGLWEYVRHQFFLSYISMELGNFLTPIIAYLISITLLLKLFRILEHMQEQLNQERAAKGVLVTREQLAREFHDGIAQTLFLLSVKIDAAQRKKQDPERETELTDMKKTIHEVNNYVRQTIHNLKTSDAGKPQEGQETLECMLRDLSGSIGIPTRLNWKMPEDTLRHNEKLVLLSCIREAVVNVQKHANASEIIIESDADSSGWKCIIQDNGIGIAGDPFQLGDRFGLRIMKERALEMNWKLQLVRLAGHTVIELSSQ